MKKIKVLSYKDLPSKLPIHSTVTAFLLLNYLKDYVNSSAYIVISTVFTIFFILLWIAVLYVKLAKEEYVSLLNGDE